MPAADPAPPPTSVLDASAPLAMLHGEQGGPIVARAIDAGAVIGVVNLAEVLTKLVEKGRDPQRALDALRKTDTPGGVLAIKSLTPLDCVTVARLRSTTKPQGLSLADRACLALASRLGVPALTADRTWAAAKVEAEITLIR
jgi:PIN domain nuclease of toxin-antitoxin system